MRLQYILIPILALSLAACSPKQCRVPGVSRTQACLELRRQLIFIGNTTDPTLSPYQYSAGNWSSPTRQALLMRKYAEFHCDEVLRENCSPVAQYRCPK